MSKDVKYCPRCKGDLKDDKKLAKNCKFCSVCDYIFFILITSNGKKRK